VSGPGLLLAPALVLALFTGVRGRGILRNFVLTEF
jgi:hypothetical protein